MILIASITYTTNVCHPQPTYQGFYLHVCIFTCNHPGKSLPFMKISSFYENLFESFLSRRISSFYENFFKLLLSVRIFFKSLFIVIVFLNLFCLSEFFICENLFLLWKSFWISSFYENLFKPFLFVKMFLFMLICKKYFLIYAHLWKVYFRDISFEMHFLRKQFWSALMFWNEFFEGAIILIFWFMTAE